MSVDVDSLFVFATNRSQYVLEDQLAAIRWTCEDRSYHVVVVDDAKQFGVPRTHGDVTFIHSQVPSRKHLSGFKNNECVAHAINNGFKFKQVIYMDDDSLPIKRGLDDWGLKTLTRTKVDLLGVEDRLNYQEYWPHYEPMFREWGVEGTDNWYPSSASLFYATGFMSHKAAHYLFEHNLLVPPGCERWGLWPDIYISWVLSMTGHYVMGWGHMDRPKAPLYLNHMHHMRHAPDPRILRHDFMVYHPLRGVAHYSEEHLREHYKCERAGQPPTTPTD